MVRAPGAAAEAVSDALGTAGRAATSLKEGAYGAADSVSRLASAPAELADRRRRQQQVYLCICFAIPVIFGSTLQSKFHVYYDRFLLFFCYYGGP